MKWKTPAQVTHWTIFRWISPHFFGLQFYIKNLLLLFFFCCILFVCLCVFSLKINKTHTWDRQWQQELETVYSLKKIDWICREVYVICSFVNGTNITPKRQITWKQGTWVFKDESWVVRNIWRHFSFVSHSMPFSILASHQPISLSLSPHFLFFTRSSCSRQHAH